MNYPYQIVAFIDVNPEPDIGTPIYDGPRGWIPNVALKRRFRLVDISEHELIELLNDFIGTKAHFFGIAFTKITQLQNTTEEALEVMKIPSLMIFHRELIDYLGEKIESRYPERDGESYFPHMTLTWRGVRVIDPNKYLPSAGQIGTKPQFRACLIKDPDDSENAKVLRYFDIKN